MMLTETRDVLSLPLYLVDIVSCTTRVIVQDGIDLMTKSLEKKAVLASLIALLFLCFAHCGVCSSFSNSSYSSSISLTNDGG